MGNHKIISYTKRMYSQKKENIINNIKRLPDFVLINVEKVDIME